MVGWDRSFHAWNVLCIDVRSNYERIAKSRNASVFLQSFYIPSLYKNYRQVIINLVKHVHFNYFGCDYNLPRLTFSISFLDLFRTGWGWNYWQGLSYTSSYRCKCINCVSRSTIVSLSDQFTLAPARNLRTFRTKPAPS